MQRTRNNINAHKVFPLLDWKLCECCGKEFVRERGYYRLTGPYYGGLGRQIYVCGRCVGSVEEAHEWFEERDRKIKNSVPPSPPPPPPKKK